MSATMLAAALAIGIIVAEFIGRRIISSILVAVVVGVVLIHLGDISLRESIGGKRSRERYLDVDRTSRELGRNSPGKPLWFWYSYSPGADQHYTSIASTYLWEFRLVGKKMPETEDARFDSLRRGSFIAIMDSNQAVLDQAVTAAAHAGYTLSPVERLNSTVGESRYLISLFRVSHIDARPLVYTQSMERTSVTPVIELLDYDTGGLLQHTEHDLYGAPVSQPPSLPAGVIRITDIRDHFGTRFQPVTSLTSGPITAVEVTVDDDGSKEEFGAVNMIFQDQGYTTLYRSGTIPDREEKTIVALPAGTRAIRVAFLPNEDGYIKLPQHVRLEGFKKK
jgi:hypothetical protein